jgi:secondary thiamine-phosphate synthase enzyme
MRGQANSTKITCMRRFTLEVSTNGSSEIINLMPLLQGFAEELAGVGLLHLFVPGSTAAITTVEFEPGLVKHDLPQLFERLASETGHYYHEQTWNDDNGHSHLLAALLGPEITVPFEDGKILTGDWQQVVLIDFDTRARRRKVICSVMG